MIPGNSSEKFSKKRECDWLVWKKNKKQKTKNPPKNKNYTFLFFVSVHSFQLRRGLSLLFPCHLHRLFVAFLLGILQMQLAALPLLWLIGFASWSLLTARHVVPAYEVLHSFVIIIIRRRREILRVCCFLCTWNFPPIRIKARSPFTFFTFLPSPSLFARSLFFFGHGARFLILSFLSFCFVLLFVFFFELSKRKKKKKKSPSFFFFLLNLN